MDKETREAMDALGEVVAFFGWRRAAEIFGTTIVLALWEGQDAAAQSIKDATPSYPTKNRLRADLRRFRLYLEAKGKGHLLGEPGEELERVNDLAKNGPALGELRKAG